MTENPKDLSVRITRIGPNQYQYESFDPDTDNAFVTCPRPLNCGECEQAAREFFGEEN